MRCLFVQIVLSLVFLVSVSKAGGESGRPLGLDLYRPVPLGNPLTPEKIKLGRRLFRERLLSRDRSLACADCHQPRRAFTDGRARSVGVYGRPGPRSVPTLINRAWGESFFWDGRIQTLEEQVLQPITSRGEMDLTLEEAVERLRSKRRYRKAFERVFEREVNSEDLGRALAAYVRTIQAGNSPYDRYLLGDATALSAEAREGLQLFRGKANCTACHVGPTFSDEEFHNTGVAWRDGEFHDDGRFLVTGAEEDRGKFKTPTLREIVRTAPYTHDGTLVKLEDVIDFYSEGGRRNPNLDPEIRALQLSSQEKRALLAFLRSLSGKVRDMK